MHSRDHADSECIKRAVDREGVEFIGSKEITYSLTYRHSTLYDSTSTDMVRLTATSWMP